MNNVPLIQDVVSYLQVSIRRLGWTSLKELGDSLFLVIGDALHVQMNLLFWGIQLLILLLPLLLLLLLLVFICSISWTLANPVVTAF
jgi:hypothetical protein